MIRSLFIDQTSGWEVSGGYFKLAANMLYARKRPNFSDMKKGMKLIWCTNMSILFFLDQTQWITGNSSNWPNQMSPNGYLEPSIIHFSSQFLTRISLPSLLLIFGSGTSHILHNSISRCILYLYISTYSNKYGAKKMRVVLHLLSW